MSGDSLNQSIDRASKYYSSLFSLPPYRKVVLLLSLTCLSLGLLSTIALFPFYEALIHGFLLGFSVLIMSLVLDLVVSKVILRPDPIYNLRRTAAVSLYSFVLWFFFVFIGALAANPFGSSWLVRLCLLGFSAVLILRLVAILGTSSSGLARSLVASLIHPFSCIVLFLLIWMQTSTPIFPILLFILFSLGIGLASSFLFTFALNLVGKKSLAVPSLSLLKVFLLNWVLDLNVPFEEYLEKLGEEQDVEIGLLKFSSSKPKGMMIVPSIHPGPFKNIGSSLLPSMLKTTMERELGSVVAVPHGLLGHEFDLASQNQNRKVVDHVAKSAHFKVQEATVTPFTVVSNGVATACCQIFGRFAIISFTLAPKTTEDFPKELGLFVCEKAKRLGLDCCIVVNAHNSIRGSENMEEALDALKTVAADCLEKTSSLKQMPFSVGAATVVPKKFTLQDGMGQGGITVFVVEAGERKNAYVIIDGNNMVSGLREKILLRLRALGIDEGEVFTTDTHAVSAIVMEKRGYHPVGEVMGHECLIGHIEEATRMATSDFEKVEAGCLEIVIPNVKVIGEKSLKMLCLLVDKAYRRAKRIALPIFASSGLFLMLFLMFI